MIEITISNYIFLSVCYIFVLIFINYLSRRYKFINKRILIINFLYHTFFCLFTYKLVGYAIGNDSHFFYFSAKEYIDNKRSLLTIFGFGTSFIQSICYVLIKYVKLSYLPTSLFFNIFGSLGIVMFYTAVAEKVHDQKKVMKLLNIIIFIPGLSYWTSYIGKDPLILFGLGIVIFSLNNIAKRYLLLVPSLLIVLNTRPYIFIVMIFSLIIAFLFSSEKIKLQYRIIFILFFILLLVPAVPMFLEHTRMSSLDISTATAYIGASQHAWDRGGSTVDISNYNIILKIFTFLYRPLFFDVRTILMFFSSLENLILLIITLRLINLKFIKFIKDNPSLLVRFNIIYFISGTIIMAITTANLGTAVRHKYMVMISLLVIFLIYSAYVNQNKKKIISGKYLKYTKR